jgi:hypothetical protein
MTLARCLEEIDWTAKAAIQGKLIDGRYRGTAIGCYLEGGASGPKESARLVLEADGKISVHVGSSSIGQGLETVCAQIAADALEVSMQDISAVHHGSTDDVIEGYGSYSSRSVVMGGNALVMAADGLRDAIRWARDPRERARRRVLAVHEHARRRPGQVVQQGPGDELVGGPLLGPDVGPEQELVRHPGEHADGGVVHGVAKCARLGRMHPLVGRLGLAKPLRPGEALLLGRRQLFHLGWLRAVGLYRHELGPVYGVSLRARITGANERGSDSIRPRTSPSWWTYRVEM